MLDLGIRTSASVAELTPLDEQTMMRDFGNFGRGDEPLRMPFPNDGFAIICGGDNGLGIEKLFVCESLEDMKDLFEGYATGLRFIQIHWYQGRVTEVPSAT